jgi:hypothetical protein
MIKWLTAAAGLAALALPYAFAQSACKGTTVTGVVRDTTLALIPDATLTLDGSRNQLSGPDGRFSFPCVDDGPHKISVTAAGFAVRAVSVNSPHNGPLEIVMKPESVETQVEVNGSDESSTTTTSSGPTQTISGSRLQSLADA